MSTLSKKLFMFMKCMQVFGGKPEGKEPRFMWKDNIKTELREIIWSGMDWIHLAQDRGQVDIRVP
jgi:hypothetical protein